MISDNPSRVASPGEHWMDSLTDRDHLDSVQDRAFDTARDAGMFDRDDSLLDCCTAAIDMQPNTILTSREMLREQVKLLTDDAVKMARFESDFTRIFGVAKC